MVDIFSMLKSFVLESMLLKLLKACRFEYSLQKFQFIYNTKHKLLHYFVSSAGT